MKQTIFYRALRKIYHQFKKDNQEYKPISKEKFLRQINKYKVISFDMFDTLITRLFYEPDDVFILMGRQIKDPNFLEKRKKAESHARENLQKDVNLNEIYASYQELYHEDVKKLQTLEEEIELDFCIPRKDVLEIFEELKKKEKKIIITSDMYLPLSVIEKMLHKCGYEGYDQIFLSNEINKRKDTKTIWPYIKELYPKQKICHIGDNQNSDVLYPQEFQIKTIYIPNGKTLFLNTSLYQHINPWIQNRTTEDSLYLGLIINQCLCNSPFSTLKIETLQEFSYLFYGPLMEEFLNYITENTSSQDKLLFLAREGYYLQKLYQEYVKINHLKEVENFYYLASRKATSFATIKSTKDIKAFTEKDYEGTLHGFFKNNFDISLTTEDEELILPKDKEKVTKLLTKYQEDILARAKIQRECYQKYTTQMVGNGNVVLIDLGYSGSIQYNLSKVLNQKLKGLYLASSENIKKHGQDELSFYFDAIKKEEFIDIYHYSLVLEYFLTAPYGQFQGFEESKTGLEPIYNDEVMSEEKQKNVEVIFKEIENFFQDQQLIKKYKQQPITKELLCQVYKYIIEDNYLTREVKDSYKFMDAYSREEEKNVFQIIGRY